MDLSAGILGDLIRSTFIGIVEEKVEFGWTKRRTMIENLGTVCIIDNSFEEICF